MGLSMGGFPLFQSTPPVKAATKSNTVIICGRAISIHAAREGGDSIIGAVKLRTMISIHAAREGGDLVSLMGGCLPNLFQSTPPVKAATAVLFYV